jgi:hypothetical protein
MGSGEGAFGAVLAGDMVLLGRELVLPLGVGLDDFHRLVGRIHDDLGMTARCII